MFIATEDRRDGGCELIAGCPIAETPAPGTQVTAAGYSGRPQADKLGLRAGQRVYLHHPPPGWALADPRPELTDAGPTARPT